eukprot:jgi/Bigna1/69107/fgenesh1_pg.8_\
MCHVAEGLNWSFLSRRSYIAGPPLPCPAPEGIVGMSEVVEVRPLSHRALVLTVPGLRILLECPLCPNIKAKNGQAFLGAPDFSVIDLSTIDLVICSNFHSLSALPYLTKSSRFEGRILATEPSVLFAKILMQQRLDVTQDSSFAKSSETSKYASTASGLGGWGDNYEKRTKWLKPYSAEDIDKSFEQIQYVNFGECIHTRSWTECDASLTAVSSGYGIGASNWILEIRSAKPDGSSYKIGYLHSSANDNKLHSQEIDHKVLANCDILIATDIAESSYYPRNKTPDSASESFSRLCREIEFALSREMQILIPVYPCGVLFEILEHLPKFLGRKSKNPSSKNPQIRIDLVSKYLSTSFRACKVLSEWLGSSRQQLAIGGVAPFQFLNEIERPGTRVRLSLHSDEASYRRSDAHILFVCPSLMHEHYVEKWLSVISTASSKRKTALICCEPPFQGESSTFQSVLRRSFKIEPKDIKIETRLRAADLKRLLPKIQPKHLIASKRLIELGDFLQEAGCPVTTFSPNRVARVQISPFAASSMMYREAYVDKRFLSVCLAHKETCESMQTDMGTTLVPFRATAITKDGRIFLQGGRATSTEKIEARSNTRMDDVYFRFLTRELNDLGIYDVEEEQDGKQPCVRTLRIQSLNATMTATTLKDQRGAQLGSRSSTGQSINVECTSANTRSLLRKAISRCSARMNRLHEGDFSKK